MDKKGHLIVSGGGGGGGGGGASAPNAPRQVRHCKSSIESILLWLS